MAIYMTRTLNYTFPDAASMLKHMKNRYVKGIRSNIGCLIVEQYTIEDGSRDENVGMELERMVREQGEEPPEAEGPRTQGPAGEELDSSLHIALAWMDNGRSFDEEAANYLGATRRWRPIRVSAPTTIEWPVQYRYQPWEGGQNAENQAEASSELGNGEDTEPSTEE